LYLPGVGLVFRDGRRIIEPSLTVVQVQMLESLGYEVILGAQCRDMMMSTDPGLLYPAWREEP